MVQKNHMIWNISYDFIVDKMKQKFLHFSLIGEMKAKGEEFNDHWVLKMIDGHATKIKLQLAEKMTECPHCGEEFPQNEK